MFGCLNDPASLNVILLYAKQFAYGQKCRGDYVVYEGFRNCIGKMFEVEKCAARRNDRMENLRRTWKPFVTVTAAAQL